jgi:hypothetical protein
MRIMLQFTIPVEKGNEAVADGSISQAIKDLVNKTQAESAYFYLRNGKRCGMVVFEETDAARFAAINEPLFARLNAEIEIQPVLVLDDLLKTF